MYSLLQTYWVHLKVYQLSPGQSNDDLSLVDSTAHNSLLSWSLPLIHSFISSNMADAIWVHLGSKRTERGLLRAKKTLPATLGISSSYQPHIT